MGCNMHCNARRCIFNGRDLLCSASCRWTILLGSRPCPSLYRSWFKLGHRVDDDHRSVLLQSIKPSDKSSLSSARHPCDGSNEQFRLLELHFGTGELDPSRLCDSALADCFDILPRSHGWNGRKHLWASSARQTEQARHCLEPTFVRRRHCCRSGDKRTQATVSRTVHIHNVLC